MIFIKIGVILLMLNVGVKIVESILKKNYGAKFLLQLGFLFLVVIGIASMDLVGMYFNHGWLLFPSMINSFLEPLGISLVYSDKLNVWLTMIGVGITLLMVYIVARKKEGTSDKKKIKLFDLCTNIPVYVYIRDFNYLFLWIGLTTFLLYYSYYSYIFDLGSMDKRIAIPLLVLCGIFELLLTLTHYFFIKELNQISFMISLLGNKENHSDTISKIDSLLAGKTVYVQGKEIDDEFKACVDMCVFEVIGIEQIRSIKLEDTVQIKLTGFAKKIFSNQEEILSNGIVIYEKDE
ncbi:hypothetical protein AAFA94_002634 [Enterococcus faecalis]